MNSDIERNMGKQPIAEIMDDLGLSPHDLVAVSKVPITHKMIARARKGRRLTINTKNIVQNALNLASNKTYKVNQLFNY